jgi:hypothetical protein
MFVALDDWILFGEAKEMLVGGFLGGPTRTDVPGFGLPWRAGWQERFHVLAQPARRTAG